MARRVAVVVGAVRLMRPALVCHGSYEKQHSGFWNSGEYIRPGGDAYRRTTSYLTDRGHFFLGLASSLFQVLRGTLDCQVSRSNLHDQTRALLGLGNGFLLESRC